MLLQLIRASEFIRFDTHEHLDYEASKTVLQALATSCRKRGVNRALLDLRPLPVLEKPWFSSAELAGLVQTFHDAGFLRPQRLAVLYRYDIHRGIRNFAFISRMRGMQVQAFTDFEEALQWLSEEDARKDAVEGEVSVPIAKAARAAKNLPASVAVKQSSAGASRHGKLHARDHPRLKPR